MSKFKGLLEEIKGKQAGTLAEVEAIPPSPAPLRSMPEPRTVPADKRGAGPSESRQKQQPGLCPGDGLCRGRGAYCGQKSLARHERHRFQRPGERPAQAVGQFSYVAFHVRKSLDVEKSRHLARHQVKSLLSILPFMRRSGNADQPLWV